MGERADCPYCTRGSTALTRRGLLAYHNGRYGVPCPAGGLTVDEARSKKAFDDSVKYPRRKPPPRPTPSARMEIVGNRVRIIELTGPGEERSMRVQDARALWRDLGKALGEADVELERRRIAGTETDDDREARSSEDTTSGG